LNQGESVTVIAEGADEQAAVDAIGNYLNGKTE